MSCAAFSVIRPPPAGAILARVLSFRVPSWDFLLPTAGVIGVVVGVAGVVTMVSCSCTACHSPEAVLISTCNVTYQMLIINYTTYYNTASYIHLTNLLCVAKTAPHFMLNKHYTINHLNTNRSLASMISYPSTMTKCLAHKQKTEMLRYLCGF